MFKEVEFDELPEEMRESVANFNQVGLSCGSPDVKILKCATESRNGHHVHSRCLLKTDEGCVAVFDKYQNDPITMCFLSRYDLGILARAAGVKN